MSDERNKVRSAVRRNRAENYVLTSLVTFGITVIAVRAFLQLTGFPQLGTSVLHIAHAIWGGLILFVAVLLPLLFANRWAIQASALLSGVGIGLFIDEVGKFITQTNDYFFPPALSLIYVFFLIILVLYLYLLRSRRNDPRSAMYHAIEGLKDAIDSDLDTEEAARIEDQLTIAKQSDREEFVFLANAIGAYIQQERTNLLVAKPGYWKRMITRVDTFGWRLGRPLHRSLISLILIFWILLVIGYIIVLIVRNPVLDDQIVRWHTVLIVLQAVIGSLLAIAAAAWFGGREERGLNFAIAGFLFSLVALQPLYFFLSQFQAITFNLIQFIVVLILLAYRRWYLRGSSSANSVNTLE
jgi:hypothetical protein